MKRRAERQQLYCLEQSKKLLKALGTQCEKPFLIHGENHLKFMMQKILLQASTGLLGKFERSKF